MVFSLLTSYLFSMQIVSWSDSINISDSLLVFIPLLLDLTRDICLRFWSCVSKNCSKESIPSLRRNIRTHRCIVLERNCRDGIDCIWIIISWSIQGLWQKERTITSGGSIYSNSLVLKCFHSFSKGAIKYATTI